MLEGASSAAYGVFLFKNAEDLETRIWGVAFFLAAIPTAILIDQMATIFADIPDILVDANRKERNPES
jgi:hypothetical protein